MLLVNGRELEITRFPDNTFKFDLEKIDEENEIIWHFESMEELFTLIGLADKFSQVKTKLFMPYMPNARMDKTQDESEGFMLKYLVQTLDNLGFDEIEILDPHSEVYKRWTKKTKWTQNDELVKDLIKRSESIIKLSSGEEVTFVYPDNGARNRYSSMLGSNNDLYGVKERDQATGEIISFDLVGDVPEGPVLIVDDICSKGGTFYYTAKKLREKGFKGEIYLYITHAEETIKEGKLLRDDSEITKVFTTNSILNKALHKITKFTLEGEINYEL